MGQHTSTPAGSEIAVLGLLALASVALSGGLAGAADADRGKLLHDTHCMTCHDDAIYTRADRKANTFEQLRGQVRNWQGVAGNKWSDEDIDAVAHEINDRYYHLPCPNQTC